MKELTKKMLESGLIDTYAAKMMEHWGQLDPEALDLIGRKAVTVQTLTDFVEEIDALTESADEFRETRLDIDVKMITRAFVRSEDVKGYMRVFVDTFDHLIIPVAGHSLKGLRRGAELMICTDFHSDGKEEESQWVSRMVEDIEPLFEDEKMIAFQVTIDSPL